MLNLTWHFINNEIAVTALRRLMNEQLESTTAARVARIFSSVNSEMQKALERWHQMLGKYNPEKGPDGVIVGWPNGPYKFPTKEIEKQYLDEFEGLLSTPFEVKAHKIQESKLPKMKPIEILNLMPVLEQDVE